MGENAGVPSEKKYPPNGHRWATGPRAVSRTFADERKPEELAREWLPAAGDPPPPFSRLRNIGILEVLQEHVVRANRPAVGQH